jgi:hypothetical protein
MGNYFRKALQSYQRLAEMIKTVERNGKDAILFTFEFHSHELEAKGYEAFG